MGRLADSAHAVGMARVGHLHDDRVDHGEVGGDGHPVVEEARVLQLAVLAVDVLLVERPADALRGAALELALHVARVHGLARVLGHGVAEDGHAPGLGVDLDVDQVGAEARARALGVDPPDAADGAAGLAGDLGEVHHRHGFGLAVGVAADGLDDAMLERDLLHGQLPELGGAPAQLALDLLGRLHHGHGAGEGGAAAAGEELKPTEPVSPMIGRTLS